MAQCACCGGPYDMARAKGERCGECYGTLTHHISCGGPHCALHCPGLEIGPDGEPDDQDYATALAEGRYDRTMSALRGRRWDTWNVHQKIRRD